MRRLFKRVIPLLAIALVISCGGNSTGPDNSDSGSGGDNSGSDNSGSSTGTVEITISTSGDNQDSDGYTVTIGDTEESISVNGTVSVEMDEGSYDVELSGIASNCSVDGENPKTVDVTAGETTSTTFNISCQANTGSVEVTTSTSGENQDSDGYSFTIADRDTSIGINETVTIDGLDEGSYNSELSGIAENCSVDGENPRTIEVTAGEASATTFNIVCETKSVNKIAFYRGDNLFTVKPDGTDLQEVDGSYNNGSDPSWSPDGSKIVFDNYELYQNEPDLYTIKPDGSELEEIVDSYYHEFDPAWGGENGETVAFTKIEDGNYLIFKVKLNGSDDQVQVTDKSGRKASWSHDGTQIAFESSRDGDSEIYVIKPDGTGLKQVTDNSVDDYDPSWSPDDSRLAFGSSRNGQNNIYTVKPDGSDEKKITTGQDYQNPSWSPDGSQIVFEKVLDNSRDIYVIKLDGSAPEKIVEDAYSPAWSP